MKRRKRILQLLIAACLLALLLGCPNAMLDQKMVGEDADATGTVQLSVQQAATGTRTIMPSQNTLAIAWLDIIGLCSEKNASIQEENLINNSSVPVDGLVVGEWTIQVKGKNTDGVIVAAGTTTVTIQADTVTPATVTLRPVTGTGTLSISVAWPDTITSPAIEGTLTPKGGAAEAVPFPTVSGSSVSYTYNDLANGSYTLLLTLKDGTKAIAHIGEAVSVFKDITTDAVFDLTKDTINLPPVQPSVLDVTAVSEYTVELSWQDNALTEAGFTIMRKREGGSYLELIQLGANVEAFIDDTVEQDTTYYYTVHAYNDFGNSLSSNEGTVTTSAPGQPIPQAVSPTNDTTPEINWAAVTDAVLYRWQVDSEDPAGWTEVSTLITTPTLSEGTHTIYVQARNAEGTWSNSGEKSIVIDTTPPAPPTIPQLAAADDSGIFDSDGITSVTENLTFSGTAEQDALVAVRVNGSSAGTEVSAVGGSWTVDVPTISENGTPYTVTASATDLAGNISSESGTLSLTIDATAPANPVVTATTPTKSVTPTWQWDVPNGTVMFRYQVDGELSGAWTETADSSTTDYTSPTIVSEGDYTLYVQAVDAAGNWSASGSSTVTVDITPPTAPSVTADSPTNNQTPTWNWTLADPSDVSMLRYQLDGQELGMWNEIDATVSTFTAGSALSEEPHTLYVQAQDEAGNWSSSGSAEVVIDITPPSAPVVSGESPTADDTPTWSWSAGSDAILYRYQLNSESSTGWQEVDSTTTTYTPSSALSDDTHILYVQAQDEAGNWSVSGTGEIVVNTQIPTVTGITPTADTTPTWTWEVPAYAVETRYQLDSEAGTWQTVGVGTTSFTPPTALTTGQHILYVQVKDANGVWSPSGYCTIDIQAGSDLTVSVTIDLPTEVTMVFDGQSIELLQGTDMTVTATPSETADSYQWFLDNTLILSGAAENSVTVGSTLNAGVHQLTLVVTKDGHMYSDDIVFTVVTGN